MSRILVTGATGYIGSHLARSLLADHEVYALARVPIRTEYIADIQSQINLLIYDGSYKSLLTAMKVAQPELVYHLATYYTRNHGETETPRLIEANITLGAYLLEAMSTCGCSALVYASTVTTHFRGGEYCPLSLYAATKQAFSDLLLYYTDTGLLRAATLILSDTYGPGDHRPKILNLVQQAAQAGDTLLLSDGTQDYDVVYIDDVIRAFRQAGRLVLTQPWKNEVFQVASEKPQSLRETVELMIWVNSLSLNVIWGGCGTADRGMRRAVHLYPSVPGWKQQIPLHEGLAQLNG